MAKIKDLQTAMKLAKITNRPLEDFYEAPTQQVETIIDQQDEEERVDNEQVQDSESIVEDIQEVQASPVVRVREVYERVPRESAESDAALVATYGGRISDGGKLICGRDITRKEYLALTKDMTQKSVLESPLLYVLFRSEGQTEGHFVQWLSRFPEE